MTEAEIETIISALMGEALGVELNPPPGTDPDFIRGFGTGMRTAAESLQGLLDLKRSRRR